jgi:hypothetical protein
MWPSKYSFNWNAMDVGPKRDLLGISYVTPRSYIRLYKFYIQVISLMLFVIVLALNSVYIIQCLNGSIHCISKINRMSSRHNYLPVYVVPLFKKNSF